MIFNSPTIQVSLLPNGIANLVFNSQSSVNIFSKESLESFAQAILTIKNTSSIKGVILTSTKDSFLVGADIFEFLDLFSKDESLIISWLKQVNDTFCQLEDLPFPTLSAINGYALGGGCEVILSTDFRIAEPSSKIGLPETKLGIYPGFGGTVRLPRIIGLDNAIEMITGAKEQSADAALKLGLIDAIVDKSKLVEIGCKIILDAVNGKLNWKSKRDKKLTKLKLSPIDSMLAFSVARGLVFSQAKTFYPAPMKVLDILEKCIFLDRDSALSIENEGFISVAKSDVAKSLIGIYLNDQYIKGISKKAKSTASKIDYVSVLGAGIMGGGISYQSARKGFPVIMKDINDNALTLGLNEASKLLNAQVAKGYLSPAKMADILNKITPTLDYVSLKNVDLVIEAVVENPKVKSLVLSEVEGNIKDSAVITSNTSTISINTLAKSLKNPSRFCGMHFFNPVHKMPLVEIIKGEYTTQETIDTCVNFVSSIGKVPIVVNDCPGFFVNRVLFPYFAGFNQLLNDGVDFKRIDSVMEKQFGWPMGPAYLIDVVGIDTATHAAEIMREGFPTRMTMTNNVIQLLFENGRLGQKNNIGFYKYAIDKKGRTQKVSDPVVYDLLKNSYKSSIDISDAEIIDRMMIPMIIETVRCLEEGIIASPAEADLGLVYGLGFPPFRGGVFRYLDTIGLSNFIELATKYESLGEKYIVTDSMKTLGLTNTTYFK